MTRLKRPLAFAASALLALGLLTHAGAAETPAGALVAGDRAAEIECKEAVNAAGPISLKGLRGRVVLLELFSTGWGPCKTQVGHLDKLDETLKDKGLTVIAVTRQDRSAVDKFIEETGAKHTIVIESGDSMGAYGSRSWPTTFLIDPGGRIAYRGSTVPDNEIDKLLDSVKILPDFPKALKSVRKSFDKEKFADAQKAIAKLLEKGKLEGEDKAAAEGISEWLTWYANSALEGAAKDSESGNHYEAWRAYMDVAGWYKGAAEGTRAAALAKEMLGDDEKKAEIKAGDKFAKLKVKIADLSPKKAVKALQAMTGKKYRDTQAGKKAAALIKQLESAR